MANIFYLSFICLSLTLLSSPAPVSAISIERDAFSNPKDGAAENKKNWSLLLKGMTYDEVRTLIGKPDSVIEGLITTWCYPKGGSINFVDGKVKKWTKPFSWDY
ncbi:MAG: hypothetical protein Q7S07_03875 [Candidatus Omnitrophota bacterium]|nr:hypothetical protein [Candidatus Omnitrophota bacterium]